MSNLYSKNHYESIYSKKISIIYLYCYDTVEQWVAKYGFASSKKSMWSEELNQFSSFLPSGAILELGCGGGREAKRLIEMGYKYTGLDAAGKLIKILSMQFPQATFLHKNLDDLDSLDVKFDGFWCAGVFLHIPKNDSAQILRNIKKCINPGGVGFISLLEGEGERYDEKTGRSFFLYGLEEFSDLLKKNGFHIIKRRIRERDATLPWLRRWQTYFVRT